ncbi:MAG: zinc-dependent alcohol dehydrogenase family protein [Firmicutes bacterium]|nr:zinc-dependent alcohol dehydrogenase family protein [Bacillota bacterium]MDH7496384.1 zinc-dependent alcohol dehydrogenase family protein [Bacillota bacterium]
MKNLKDVIEMYGTFGKMSAAVFRGPGQIDLELRDVPSPGPGEVLVRVEACGVCGTDFHIFRGEAPARPPVILGHEYCGTVVALGTGVAGLEPGDRVAVDPNMACGRCHHCGLGKVHLCESLEALGVTVDGGFSEYSIAPIAQCHVIPAHMSAVQGAFVEPVACCVHGIDLAGIMPGHTVVVLGGGTIGLILLQLAKRSGATTLIVSEPAPRKRELALEFGATLTVDPVSSDLEEQVRVVAPAGADVVIEAVGRPETVEAAVRIAARGGCVLLFGVAPESARMTISPFTIYKKELRLQGSYVNPFTFSRAISLLAHGAVDVEPLVERIVPLDRLPSVLSSGPSGGGAKTLVSMDARRD